MAIWRVAYDPLVNCDINGRQAGHEIPCFRIFPEGDPERWIARTNPNLPAETQEETALLIADALSNLLGM
jgi:hypothetical protein